MSCLHNWPVQQIGPTACPSSSYCSVILALCTVSLFSAFSLSPVTSPKCKTPNTQKALSQTPEGPHNKNKTHNTLTWAHAELTIFDHLLVTKKGLLSTYHYNIPGQILMSYRLSTVQNYMIEVRFTKQTDAILCRFEATKILKSWLLRFLIFDTISVNKIDVVYWNYSKNRQSF